MNEVRTFQDRPGGSVSGFAVDRKTGRLTGLNQQSSRGAGPAHLVVDREGRNVLVANYGGGSVAVLPLGSDGMLKPASAFVQHEGSSIHPRRQTRPHAHSINVDPATRFAFAAVKPGSGPRHFAFHPEGRFAYVINEILLTVTAFRHDKESGALAEAQTISTLPPGQEPQEGFSTAEVQVHPSGRFLYGSNRGHDTIVVFSIDQETGRLTYVQNESTQVAPRADSASTRRGLTCLPPISVPIRLSCSGSISRPDA